MEDPNSNARFETAEKAIAMLAMRVSNLEMSHSGTSSGGGSGNDLRPFLSAILTDLKNLRTEILKAASVVEDHMKELSEAHIQQDKLRYQIKHLVQSLEEEERKNAK